MPYDPRRMGMMLQNMQGPQGGSLPNVPVANSRMGNSPVQAVMPSEQLQPPRNESLGYQSPNQPNPPPIPQNRQQRLVGPGNVNPPPAPTPRGY